MASPDVAVSRARLAPRRAKQPNCSRQRRWRGSPILRLLYPDRSGVVALGCASEATKTVTLDWEHTATGRQRRMERLWSPAVATGGNQRQLLQRRKRANQSENCCRALRPVA